MGIHRSRCRVLFHMKIDSNQVVQVGVLTPDSGEDLRYIYEITLGGALLDRYTVERL